MRPDDHHYRSLTRHVILPFSIISLLHVVWGWYTSGEVKFDPTVAPYTLWFMFAVIFWRGVGPYLWQLRYPLLVAAAVSLFAGQFSSLWVFGLHSTTGMFPFMVIGMMLRQHDNFLRERTPRRTMIAGSIVAGWFLVATLLFATANLDRATIGMTTHYGTDDLGGRALGC